MINMLDTQDKLKNFSEAQLIQEMQSPTGDAPQFMVLSEIERRKRMRQDAQRQEGLMQPTVAQEAVSAAGVPQQGIAQIAQSIAPQTDAVQNTGVRNTQAPMKMADGGRLAGSDITAVAKLKVNHPNIYAEVKDDPARLRRVAEYFDTPVLTPERTGLEELEATPSLFDRIGPSNRAVSKQRLRDVEDFGDDYAASQRAESLQALRSRGADDAIFAEGAPVEYARGTTGPTPATGIGGMFTAPPSLGAPGAGASDIALPSADSGIKTPSGFSGSLPAPNAGAAPDVSGLTEEQARRLYLSGREYEEGDVPAIVDMLNRGREFQQGDTYTPPEEIYDLGPRGRLKYEMDGASPLDQYREFTDVSNRLAQEAAAGEEAKADQFIADSNARLDTQRRADDAIDRRMYGDLPEGPLPLTDRLARGAGRFVRGLDAPSTTGAGLQIPEGGIAELLPPKSEEQIAAEEASVAERAERAAADLARAAGGAGGAGGAGAGSMDKRIADLLASREKQADQDKWLALAQVGLGLMSSTNRTFGGALGEAGAAGLAALQKSQAGAQDFETDMIKLQSELDLNRARTAAANRSGRGTSAKNLPATALTVAQNDVLAAQDLLESAGSDAEVAAATRALRDAQRQYNVVRERFYAGYGVSTPASGTSGAKGFDVTGK